MLATELSSFPLHIMDIDWEIELWTSSYKFKFQYGNRILIVNRH